MPDESIGSNEILLRPVNVLMLANGVSWFLVPLAVLGLRVEMTCSFLAHLPAVAVPLCSFCRISLYVDRARISSC